MVPACSNDPFTYSFRVLPHQMSCNRYKTLYHTILRNINIWRTCHCSYSNLWQTQSLTQTQNYLFRPFTIIKLNNTCTK